MKKKVFKLKNYKGNYAMRCRTEEEAKDFLSVLAADGREWLSRDSYSDFTHWKEYGPQTVYFFNNNTFGTKRYALDAGYIVLNWSDFKNSKKSIIRRIFKK